MPHLIFQDQLSYDESKLSKLLLLKLQLTITYPNNRTKQARERVRARSENLTQ